MLTHPEIKVSVQPSSEQSTGDVRITQLDRKWVPRVENQLLQKFCRRNCWVCVAPRKLEHRAWPQRAPSVVGHEAAAIISQVERRLAKQWLAGNIAVWWRFSIDLSSMSTLWSSESLSVLNTRRLAQSALAEHEQLKKVDSSPVVCGRHMRCPIFYFTSQYSRGTLPVPAIFHLCFLLCGQDGQE